MKHNPQRKPTHPGAILREDVLPELEVSAKEMAKRLMIPAVELQGVLDEVRPMTVRLALRLEAYFNGPSAAFWMNLQIAVDTWKAHQAFDHSRLKGSSVQLPRLESDA